MHLKRIAARSPQGNVHVLIEIAKGGHNKYELDEELGVFRLDRPLHSALYYPTEYGVVPGTIGGDGEHLDCLVMADEPTFPGCLVEVRVIGGLAIESRSGRREHKLLGVPVAEPRFAEYADIDDVPRHLLREIEHFFDVFKDLEERPIESHGWAGAAEAGEVLEKAIARFGEMR